MPTERVEFLGVHFDRLGQHHLLAELGRATADSPYGYVVTPNVDHLVRLHQENAADLWAIYDRAKYCTCDSRVVRRLARARGVELPLVAGSDLTTLMFERVIRAGDRVALIGGDAALLGELRQRFADLDFTQHIPPFGLRQDPAAIDRAAAFIAETKARFTFIAVGSPQQEMIAARALDLPGATGTAFCIGASIDFLVGRQVRAPRLVQQLGLEWAHRLLSNPRRMWRRYLVEAPRIFLLASRWRAGAGKRSS